MTGLSAGLGMGVATTGLMMLGEVLITGTTQVNLREGLAVGAVVCSAGWWLSRKLTKIEDAITDSTVEQKKLNDRVEKIEAKCQIHLKM